MKFTAILLTAFCLTAGARGGAQGVNLSVKNAHLTEVFASIEKQTGYLFFYTSSDIKKAKKVTIDVSGAQLEQVLKIVFKDQPFSYEVIEKTIVVKEKEGGATVSPEAVVKVLPPIDVKGRVVNENGQPVEGASVMVKGTKQGTTTNKDGYFELKALDNNATLVISGVSIESFEVKVNGRSELALNAKVKTTMEENVIVTGSTGYQTIPKVTTPGSFDVINKELINRKVSTNLLDRIENLSPGVLFSRGGTPDALLIRGRSTLFANAFPLIVVDNFPYDGSLSNLNPNDIESVTVLKDATAASIWGARAANGVIVVTTKRGRSSKPVIELNSNITFQGIPDLYNVNTISSSDYIELEKFLFSKNRYAADESNNNINNGHPPFTPVIELLIAKRDGLIPASQADAQIEALKQFDVRKDVEKYFYRKSVNQQYALNVGGSTPHLDYYLSGGYDRNLSDKISQNYERITFRSQNRFRVNSKFQVDAGINYVQDNNESGNNPGWGHFRGKGNLYPYASLVDANGNPTAVYTEIRKKFTDAAIQKGLNFEYRPVDEINLHETQTKTKDYTINLSAKYNFWKNLSAQVNYQYENQVLAQSMWNKDSSYFSRYLFNNYAQVSTTGTISFPIPRGGIMDISNSELASHQGRGQLNYNQVWNNKHEVAAIAGYEIRSIVTKGNMYRLYGYNPDVSLTANQIDFVTRFQTYNNRFISDVIPNPQGVSKKTDHFLSYYTNASYTYQGRYILSASARKDEANLFGVKANQKGIPLWSIGGAWIASNEDFYNLSWLSHLKLRVSYGYNGNISRLASAYTTARYLTGSVYPLNVLDIVTPPNEQLSWERVRMFNLGFDFELKNKVLSGSVEYYQKKSSNLLGQAPVDPTYGLSNQNFESFFYGNIAGIKGKGFDIELNSKNVDSRFKWFTSFLLSHSTTNVSEYLMPIASAGNVYLTSASTVNPVVGHPVFSVYSYQWAGLDSTGDPRGYYGKQVSTDWNSIYGKSRLDSMIFHGSAQPTYYGALRNTFSWKNFSLSVMLSYKMGYYIRKHSLSYGNLFGSWSGHGEYAQRWQKPGDELLTNVPSLKYPANTNRDLFYQYASVNVLKADHIRFEDVNLSYDLNRGQWKNLPFDNVRLYFYANNLGMLWKANDAGIDPYYNNIVKPAKRFSLGLNIHF